MMNIDKLREAWLQDNPKIFCFSNIFNFVQFCWAHKFTPYNSAVAYDAENDEMYLVEKELSKITNGVSAPFSTSLKTSQLIEAVALARGGERTRDLYKTTMDSFEASGDIEMTAVYAAYSKEVIS